MLSLLRREVRVTVHRIPAYRPVLCVERLPGGMSVQVRSCRVELRWAPRPGDGLIFWAGHVPRVIDDAQLDRLRGLGLTVLNADDLSPVAQQKIMDAVAEFDRQGHR